jgi:succinate dehydrogenase / fumarate reductase, membrane anchor subunit
VSLRSPLGRALGHGASATGAEHWWQQRVTAVALALLGLWLVVALLGLELGNRAALLAWIGRP